MDHLDHFFLRTHDHHDHISSRRRWMRAPRSAPPCLSREKAAPLRFRSLPPGLGTLASMVPRLAPLPPRRLLADSFVCHYHDAFRSPTAKAVQSGRIQFQEIQAALPAAEDAAVGRHHCTQRNCYVLGFVEVTSHGRKRNYPSRTGQTSGNTRGGYCHVDRQEVEGISCGGYKEEPGRLRCQAWFVSCSLSLVGCILTLLVRLRYILSVCFGLSSTGCTLLLGKSTRLAACHAPQPFFHLFLLP